MTYETAISVLANLGIHGVAVKRFDCNTSWGAAIERARDGETHRFGILVDKTPGATAESVAAQFKDWLDERGFSHDA